MSNNASLEITLGSSRRAGRRRPDEPLRILYLAGLSGNTSASPTFTPLPVSFERFESTMRSVAPAARVAIDSPLSVDESLSFSSIEDFHPDALMRSLSVMRTLSILRQRLRDPDTRDEALVRLEELVGAAIASPRPAPTGAPAEPEREGKGDMMERLLGKASGAADGSRAKQKVESFIKSIVPESGIEKDSGTMESALEQLDDLTAGVLRAVLMTDPLRTLERAWRSARWLMQRLDEDAIELFLVDASKAALSAHLTEHANELDRSTFHRLLCDASNGDPWHVVVGDYTFGLDANDLVLLTTIGAVCGQAGTLFIAHGDLNLCGCASLEGLDEPADWRRPDDELDALWTQVRSHPASQWIGLATPRLVLRQPYGPDTDPIEAFDFRELPANPAPERFLWGNPAIAVACLLAREHAGSEDLDRGEQFDVDDLPAVLYDDGSGQALQPPVEALIGERAMNQILSAGLMPMLGRRDRNSVRCPGLISISAKPLRLTV